MQQKEYNKGGFYAFLFAMVFVIVFFIYVTFIHQHSSPDYKSPAPAAATESAVSPEPVKQAAVQGDAWVSTPEQITAGNALFQTNCAVCHGPGGTGDGPAGKSLVPPPRNMVEGQWKFGGNPFQLYGVISNGSPGTSMASFAHLPEGDRWALVHFVRSITKNVVEATEADIKAHKEGAKK